MKDGIYHVRFAAAGGQAGEGLVVIKGESINGGDAGYLYRGQVTRNGDLVAAQIHVNRWNPSEMSVFGAIDSFGLTMTGRSTDASFEATGVAASLGDRSISMSGRFLMPAA